jgi:hypothetical protein
MEELYLPLPTDVLIYATPYFDIIDLCNVANYDIMFSTYLKGLLLDTNSNQTTQNVLNFVNLNRQNNDRFMPYLLLKFFPAMELNTDPDLLNDVIRILILLSFNEDITVDRIKDIKSSLLLIDPDGSRRRLRFRKNKRTSQNHIILRTNQYKNIRKQQVILNYGIFTSISRSILLHN